MSLSPSARVARLEIQPTDPVLGVKEPFIRATAYIALSGPRMPDVELSVGVTATSEGELFDAARASFHRLALDLVELTKGWAG